MCLHWSNWEESLLTFTRRAGGNSMTPPLMVHGFGRPKCLACLEIVSTFLFFSLKDDILQAQRARLGVGVHIKSWITSINIPIQGCRHETWDTRGSLVASPPKIGGSIRERRKDAFLEQIVKNCLCMSVNCKEGESVKPPRSSSKCYVTVCGKDGIMKCV